MNVAASIPIAGRAPISPTTAPPAANPISRPLRLVVCMAAVPSTYRSPARMSGSMADRAAR